MSNCIYKYTNKENNHLYIGMTNNFKRRYREHSNSALNPKSKDYNLPFHKALRKYGLDKFECEIIEDNISSIDLMKEREIYWIKYYRSNKNGNYNISSGGDHPGINSCLKGEKHGMSKLLEEEVRECRILYSKGVRSSEVYNKRFKNKITYGGFLRMWHGRTWKHIMPETFQSNPHRGKYTKEDKDYITEKFLSGNKSLRQFSQTEECYVGYSTLWNMINNPSFYDNK